MRARSGLVRGGAEPEAAKPRSLRRPRTRALCELQPRLGDPPAGAGDARRVEPRRASRARRRRARRGAGRIGPNGFWASSQHGDRIEVDLIEYVKGRTSEYRDAKCVALEMEFPTGEFRTRVIEGRIEQLLDKLLDNAVDFSDGTPVRIQMKVGESEARIRVENLGPPLPAGPAAEQLFAPMRSGRKRTRERRLGLGLYVARVIAEHHGGSIRAWNADGNRVVFEVTIRRADA